MDLTIYVHDFHLHIGHSRATVELLNGLTPEQKTSISSIEVVSYTCSDLNVMLPEFKCSKKFTKISFSNLKPFLLKMFFFHLATLFHSLTKGAKRTKMGVGIACLNVNIINVQFIHEQWKKHFFENRKLSYLPNLYKKLLFSYFSVAEKYIYSEKRKTRYIVIANFLSTFLNKNFNTPLGKMAIIPSGVNTDEFNITNISSAEQKKKLSLKYPQIKDIDTNLPIVLFVGALERKGLYKVLESLDEIPNAQLLVIGRSEHPDFVMPLHSFTIVHIPFTDEVNLFYQFADIFIFPTTYEPFGLVILEAYATGLDLLIPIENVGASEVIPKSDGIYFFHQHEKILTPKLKKISFKEKQLRRTERLGHIKDYSWDVSAQKFYKILFA